MLDRTLSPDTQPIAGVQLDDLDMTLVQRHIATAQNQGRYSGPLEPLMYLQRHHCVVDVGGTLVPTLAGVIAFSPEPERWLPASGIDVAEFSSSTPRTTNLSFIEQIRGPISAVMDRTAQILWDRSEHGYRFEGTQRIEEHAYPRIVLRELTVNALCHRDWSNPGSRVRIQIFPKYTEWISPGGLPEGVTIDNLLEAQYSRNPTIVAIMFQAHYIEGLGLGFDSVYSVLQETGVEPPQIRNTAHAFTIRVMAKPLGSNNTDLEPIPIDHKQTIRMLIAQRGELTISDLETLLGIQRRTIQRILQALVQQGAIEVVGATNNRRYRLALGQSL
jgi:predicted HTH transcriptional regulator